METTHCHHHHYQHHHRHHPFFVNPTHFDSDETLDNCSPTFSLKDSLPTNQHPGLLCLPPHTSFRNSLVYLVIFGWAHRYLTHYKVPYFLLFSLCPQHLIVPIISAQLNSLTVHLFGTVAQLVPSFQGTSAVYLSILLSYYSNKSFILFVWPNTFVLYKSTVLISVIYLPSAFFFFIGIALFTSSPDISLLILHSAVTFPLTVFF